MHSCGGGLRVKRGPHECIDLAAQGDVGELRANTLFFKLMALGVNTHTYLLPPTNHRQLFAFSTAFNIAFLYPVRIKIFPASSL